MCNDSRLTASTAVAPISQFSFTIRNPRTKPCVKCLFEGDAAMYHFKVKRSIQFQNNSTSPYP